MSFSGGSGGFKDTKTFRICILNQANKRLGLIVRTIEEGNGTLVSKQQGMLGLLDSTYKSDVPSTNYAMHLKSIAFESGRFLCTTDQVRDDIYFDSVRGEFISQNIASFLFPYNRFPTTDSTDTQVRNFYLSIVKAYFGGSTKNNITESLIKFTNGVSIGIVENFLLARTDGTLDPVVNKFLFDVNINVDDPRIKDVNKLQQDVEFLLSIIKPAHTTFTTRLIFNEFFDTFRKGCIPVLDDEGNPLVTHDGFDTKLKQASTAICDTIHLDLFDYFYEDMRKPCGVPQVVTIPSELIYYEDVNRVNSNQFQASPRVAYSTKGGSEDISSTFIYHTKYGPFANDIGDLASEITDIEVLVDGEPVEVLEIFPLSAAFRIGEEISLGQEIRCTYKVIQDYSGALITNNLDSVINNWKNLATEHNYKTVLSPTGWKPINENPDNPGGISIWESKYKYKGFDLFNSSVFNNALTLNFNEYGLRGRSNDADVFKSFEYDSGNYITTLNEDTPLMPVSLDLKDKWRRLPHQHIRMNNLEFNMNTTEDRLFGEIHHSSKHPFYSALEVEEIDNDGEKGYLQSVCEDPVAGLKIDFSRKFEEEIPKITKDWECQFYTYPSGSGHNSLEFTNLNDPECVLFGGPASTWVTSDTPTQAYEDYDIFAEQYPEEAKIDYFFAGDHGQMHLLVEDVHKERIPTLGIQDTPDEVFENTNPISYNHAFTLNAGPNFNNDGEGLDVEPLRLHWLRDPLGGLSLTFKTDKSILAQDPLSSTESPSATSIIQDINFISISKITNVTKGQDYDLTDLSIYGDKVIQLDESNSTNINIGMDAGDEVTIQYNYIDKMNDNYELVRNIFKPRMEHKFIVSEKIFKVTKVYNFTQSLEYDLEGYELIGSKIINLNKQSTVNQNIGFNTSDLIQIDYTVENIVEETSNGIILPGNFLKFEIDSSNEAREILKVRNMTRGKDYDITDYIFLDDNVILLEDNNVRNISVGIDSGDTIMITFKSFIGYQYVTSETAEVVYTPYDFRMINTRPVAEYIKVANITKQQFYDLRDNSKVSVSSGLSTASNILVQGDSFVSKNNVESKWESEESNDAVKETLFISFPFEKKIDNIILKDHNFREYNIQYYKNGEFLDFADAVYENSFDRSYSQHIFNEVITSKIRIEIIKTQIPNQQKYLHMISCGYQREVILDKTNPNIQRLGLDPRDIVYTSTINSKEIDNIEPFLSLRPNYGRSVIEIYPV